MRVLPALFFIPALTPLAYAFEFTAPDTSKPINFSEPVVFKWPTVNGNPPQPWVQLVFATGGKSQTGRWGINLDLIDTRNVSTWTWDTPEWAESVNDDSPQFLAEGENNRFEAYLSSGSNSSWLNLDGIAATETEKFEIVGYAHLKDFDSRARATTPSLGLALAAGAMVLIFSLTS
ncbi:hypothetical protein EDB81DRAFT_787688 [Dactylonectria macrodidyma]|uniref:Uncharacterized protein n=1 Tax=Dactylonectria macrodidyma TaxID=307937 RepID=A0A9P9FB00_9HYPO|nr:hypothetical protein EDB81DRAFT_787688 [Dactylonectria macrodidyma]